MKRKAEYSKEQRLLLIAIEQAVEDLKCARSLFENVNDPRLIDFAIFREEAAKARYGYLIFQAKQKGLEAACTSYLLSENQVG